MTTKNQQFQTIRTEGALLPPDILRRLASLKEEGLNPESFHLPPSTKLSEAISRSWNILRAHWQGFQEARVQLAEDDETGTSVTNDRWLLPLFNELDYGRLVTEKAPEIDERVYPIERFYNNTPIHLIGCKLPLDRRTKGARGAATASPHSMVQEYLNRSDKHLWAFLSNGLQLRILRDNVSLSRQAFVEFDLEAMMEGEVYSDFSILWLLCHQSRVEADKSEECWLEKWSKLAREEGTRVLKDLRIGVAKAIEALGSGFIGHPRNDRLRTKLRDGTLAGDDFYRQLLRIVYRLLFLFVAEDRELLHPHHASDKLRELYDKHYSTRRLRDLTLKIRGSKHSDLWHSLSLVFNALGKNEGCPELGLCGLGSFLWRNASTPDLLGPQQVENEAEEGAVLITNDDLLLAIRELAYVEQDRVLRAVDYRNLGSEELGSVYEALLELHPVMNIEARGFELLTAAGNERKITGSYYTPDSLVQCLLDSALDPVVQDRLKGKKGEEAEQVILDMKVCDPSCGSGHFLIAAAHRLARQLARIRTGESEPSPEDYQHALRDVISRCIYGVDINPMAVELCKVSLWIEAIEPGKPLSFLDGHIQCGNSLLGTTPALLAKGIPDDAFKSIEGDDSEVCSQLRKRNKRERQEHESGQGLLFDSGYNLGSLPDGFVQLAQERDDSILAVSKKEHHYSELLGSEEYQNARLLADLWCAVFVWVKDTSEVGKLCPTTHDFRRVEDDPKNLPSRLKSEVRELGEQYQFFHWHLAFPDVFVIDDPKQNGITGWSGGFDILLGNPPWDKVQPEEQQFFSTSRPDIANASGAERKRLIAALSEEDNRLFLTWCRYKRAIEGFTKFVKSVPMHELSSQGRMNTYSLFLETAWRVCCTERGFAGLIVQTGLVTDDSNKHLFNALVQSGALRSVFDFENKENLFDGVHREQRFSLVTVGPVVMKEAPIEFAFWLTQVAELRRSHRRFFLTPSDLRRMSPNTGACPTFKSRAEAEILRKMYQHGVLVEDQQDGISWPIQPTQFINMTSDSGDFLTPQQANGKEELLPLYEGKLTFLYNHRYATFDDSEPEPILRVVTAEERENPSFKIKPRYWLTRDAFHKHENSIDWKSGWFLTFHDIANPNNERTAIFSMVPRVPVGNSSPIILGKMNELQAMVLLSLGNSFAFDFASRRRIVSRHLNFFILKQLPAPNIGIFEIPPSWSNITLMRFLLPRALELTFTAWDLLQLAMDCKYDGPPFRWDDERRFLIRCEMDAAFFHLYFGCQRSWADDKGALTELFPRPREAIEHILESFRTTKRNDIRESQITSAAGEVIQEGRYITKDTILDIYDKMQEAIDSGKPYQTRLDPPPGPPIDKNGNFIPISEWNQGDWPSHIHLPRDVGEVST